MFPTVEFVKNETTFNILSVIYENILETYMTSSYERYKNEADVRFQKDIRANHLRKNVIDIRSKALRVKSYAKSFYEYKKLKEQNLQTYYENIQLMFHTEKSETMIENIWRLMSMFMTYRMPDNVGECVDRLNKIKTEFFPVGFSMKDCDRDMYMAWIRLYPEVAKLNNYISFSHPHDIMERDFGFISDMEKVIKRDQFVRFADDPLRYKSIGLIPPMSDEEILKALNKLNSTNFDTFKFTFNTYLNDDIVRVLFSNCPDGKFVPVYMKLFKFLDISDSLISVHMRALNIKLEPVDGVEKMFSEPLIAGLYDYGYIDSIDLIAKEFDKVNLAEVVVCAFEYRKQIGERWKSISKEVLYYATKLSKELTGKYKYRLMDIIDELGVKPKHVEQKVVEQPKKKIADDANQYDILAD